MAFNILPVEINEHIATYLDTDKDLTSFSLVCKETHNAIDSSHSGIWRKCFARSFDLPPGKQSHELKLRYQLRKKKLAGRFHFMAGHTNDEQRYLELLKELIVESFINTVPVWNKRVSNNLHQLSLVFRRTTLLDGMFQPRSDVKIDSLLLTIQLMLSYQSLSITPRIHQTYGFPLSQHVVYAHPRAQPMFLDKNMRKVNIEYLLHIVNFFKYHMTRKEEATLYPFLCDLEGSEKPRPWQGRLKQGVKQIGTSWKGSYAYLDNSKDMCRIRSDVPCDSRIYCDNIDVDDGFQTLDLDFSPSKPVPWPAVFERHLQSLPSPSLVHALKNPRITGCFPTTEAKKMQSPVISRQHHRTNIPTKHTNLSATPPATPSTTLNTTPPFPSTTIPFTSPSSLTSNLPRPLKGVDYIPFTGTGCDATPFHCVGKIHALPPQHGIPGWQRITLMKCFDIQSTATAFHTPSTDPASPAAFGFGDGSAGPKGDAVDWDNPDLISHGDCWAYEGIVLPGGMLMMGRWWSPSDEGVARLCTGPWIFWKVD